MKIERVRPKNVFEGPMNFFAKLSIRQRLFLLTLPFAFLLYLGGVWAIYRTQVIEVRSNTLPLMEQHLSYLIDLVNTYEDDKSDQQTFTKRLINDLQAKLRVNPEDTVAIEMKGRLLKQAEEFEEQYNEKTSTFDFEALKEDFYSRRYYKTGFPFLIDGKGYYAIHPTREQENVLTESFFRIMQEVRRGEVEYFDEKMLEDAIVYYRYDMVSEMYVCIYISKEELLGAHIKFVMAAVWILGALAVLVIIILVFYLSHMFVRPLQQIKEALEAVVRGNFRYKIAPHPFTDIISQIIANMTQHIDYLRSAANFAEEIKEGKYDMPFQPLSKEDDLGNALLAMRNNLKLAEEEREKRKADDKVRNWETEGMAKFNDLLRHSGADFEAFAYNIIKGMVDYLSAHLGGLYIYDQKDFSSGIESDELVLVASHAYGQKKFMERRFKTGEGLVGACASERKSIFMTEIPNDYLNIRSGLGESKPRSLMFVPILLENSPFGVIELASLRKFSTYEIDFVEKISTMLASTLANVKNSIRTQELLQHSQQYTEQMQLQEELVKSQLDTITVEKEMVDKELSRLKKKESQFSMLFDKSINPVMVTSEKGKIQMSNLSALQLFGLEAEQMNDVFFQELVIIKDMKLFFSRIGQWQRVKAIHMQGKITPIEVYMNLVSARGEKIMLVYMRDLSQVVKLEGELQREREENRILRGRISDMRKDS